MTAIPFKEVSILDANSEACGVTPSTLMENAGRGLAEAILKKVDGTGKNILFVCGTGNNAGDAFVAGRHLRDKCHVRFVFLKPKIEVRSIIARENLAKVKDLTEQLTIKQLPTALEWADIVVDAMLGAGVTGEPREPFHSAIGMLNAFNGSKIAVDIPSGLGTKVAFKPDVTVTFHAVKEGMNRENSGRIMEVDIGVPKEALEYVGPGELLLYPTLKLAARKGQRGKLLVVGGGPYTGAPALAALAAYRTGVDLVHVAVPENVFQVVASYSPSFIVHPFPGDRFSQEHLPGLLELASQMDAIVAGPGAGADPQTLAVLGDFILESTPPTVVDADGLKAFRMPHKGSPILLTPHAGEFRQLFNEAPGENMEQIRGLVKRIASGVDVAMLLKGPVDIISDGLRLKTNRTGSPSMTVGGTGDVLAGICGGLMAMGLSPYDSGRLGAYICGRAGELVAKRLGPSLMPLDVIECIPQALMRSEAES